MGFSLKPPCCRDPTFPLMHMLVHAHYSIYYVAVDSTMSYQTRAGAEGFALQCIH